MFAPFTPRTILLQRPYIIRLSPGTTGVLVIACHRLGLVKTKFWTREGFQSAMTVVVVVVVVVDDDDDVGVVVTVFRKMPKALLICSG